MPQSPGCTPMPRIWVGRAHVRSFSGLDARSEHGACRKAGPAAFLSTFSEKTMKMRLSLVVTMLALIVLPAHGQILVTVGDRELTSQQLEKALRSSPFATQFPTLDEEEQARLRGDMLQRLVHFELLRLEAERLHLDRSPSFRKELVRFEQGLLAQRYLQVLRESIRIPDETQQLWRNRFGADLDALAAARSLYMARHYERLKADRLAQMKAMHGEALDETAIWAKAARSEGIQVNQQVEGYRKELLVQHLLDSKEREWIPDDTVLRDYYQTHPQIGQIPERRHVGQIVTRSRELAAVLRQRILAGESLFKLASEYSIDPYGREHAGDMGWQRAGEGMPQIERALAELPDNTVSRIIETPKGFHLVMIVDRRPGEQKPFVAIKDRVRRAFLAERLPAFLESLQKRYPVRWHMADR